MLCGSAWLRGGPITKVGLGAGCSEYMHQNRGQLSLCHCVPWPSVPSKIGAQFPSPLLTALQAGLLKLEGEALGSWVSAQGTQVSERKARVWSSLASRGDGTTFWRPPWVSRTDP